MENWLDKELAAYADRDVYLHKENQKRSREMNELEKEFPGADVERGDTESEYEWRYEHGTIRRKFEEVEKTRAELRKRRAMVEKTIQEERGWQAVQWSSAMRSLQDCLQTAGLLQGNLDEYLDARNRHPAVLRDWNIHADALLGDDRYKRLVGQRLNLGLSESSNANSDREIPNYLKSSAKRYNEVLREYERAKREYDERATTYEYRRFSWE